MRKKHKGTTIVEVVVSFALISLSLAMGMAGISCGAHFMNEGARLKNEERKTAVQELKTGTPVETPVKIYITDSDDVSARREVDVTEVSANGFKRYELIGGGP